MIKENDNNQIYDKEKTHSYDGNNEINEDTIINDKSSIEKFYSNSLTNVNNPENKISNENELKFENSKNDNLIDKKDRMTVNPIAEQKSSIFNSKNLINKTELEHFYEQNNFLHMSNIYDDHFNCPDDLQNLIIYDEKIDFQSKSSKIAIPINRNSEEKPSKRKKNMNNLRRELDTPLTHSIFEKNDKIEETQRKEDETKFQFKPINKEKEEKMEKYIEQ